MPVLAAFIAALIGWAYWTRKIKGAQLPPVLLAMAGAGLVMKGGFVIGIAIIAVAAAWYIGLTQRLYGLSRKQGSAYHINKARQLLGVSVHDDAAAIRARHRKLIAQKHPDTGGNKNDASALNQARDLLLADLENNKP